MSTTPDTAGTTGTTTPAHNAVSDAGTAAGTPSTSTDNVGDGATGDEPADKKAKVKTLKEKGEQTGKKAKGEKSEKTAVAKSIGKVAEVAAEAAVDALETTGTTETKVYNGEPPMSQADQLRASKGADPLNRIVPDGDPMGGMGVQTLAQNTSIPIGPSGSVPTGSPHSDVEKVDKMAAPGLATAGTPAVAEMKAAATAAQVGDAAPAAEEKGTVTEGDPS